MKNDSSLGFVLGLSILLVACTLSPTPATDPVQLPGEENENTPVNPTSMDVTLADRLTPEVLPTSTPILLFADDFSDPNSGWERYREFDGILDYENGGYRMLVDTVNNMFWVQANLAEPLADVVVQVAVTRLSGPQDAPFGVICRLDDQNQYYYFFITSNGGYGIGKQIAQGGFLSSQLIGMDAPGVSDAIHGSENEINEIVASCAGQRLSLMVNGQLLVEVQDGDILQGDVGLLAGVRAEPKIDVWFDTIKVMKP